MPQDTYRTIIEKIARTRSSAVSVFSDFCRISACALAAQTREEEYFEVIKPYSQDELKLFSKGYALLVQEMESHPFTDVLGEYYLEIAAHSSKQARGEFYTPPAICEMMAKMTIQTNSVIEKGMPISVNEPACGAGMMVLAAAKQFSPMVLSEESSYVDLLRFTCQDINPVATDMTFINTSLWGIPAKIVLGNALSGDAPQGIWRNIHWHRVGEDERIKTLALFRMFRSIEEIQTKPEGERSQMISASPDPDAKQVEFDLDFGVSRNERGR